MKPEDRDLALLWDMRRFAREAHDLVRRIPFERLQEDRVRQLALERALELLGEAARRVSAETQRREAQVDWRALIGQRNVLAHDYGKINHRLLYDTTRRIVPLLLAELDRILGKEE
jgi:uncharacterized protein with HEPN domain